MATQNNCISCVICGTATEEQQRVCIEATCPKETVSVGDVACDQEMFQLYFSTGTHHPFRPEKTQPIATVTHFA
jgi:hypothetical protein